MFEVGDKVVIVDLDKYEDLLRTVGVSDEMEELEGKEARIICKLDKYRVYLDITVEYWRSATSTNLNSKHKLPVAFCQYCVIGSIIFLKR